MKIPAHKQNHKIQMPELDEHVERYMFKGSIIIANRNECRMTIRINFSNICVYFDDVRNFIYSSMVY